MSSAKKPINKPEKESREPRAANSDIPTLFLNADNTTNYQRWKTEMTMYLYENFGEWGCVVEHQTSPAYTHFEDDDDELVDILVERDDLKADKEDLVAEIQSIRDYQRDSVALEAVRDEQGEHTGEDGETATPNEATGEPQADVVEEPQKVVVEEPQKPKKGKKKAKEKATAEPAQPEADPDDDDAEREIKRLDAQIKTINRKIAQLTVRERRVEEDRQRNQRLVVEEHKLIEGNRLKVYACLMRSLSKISKEKVESNPKFDLVSLNKQPEELMEIVREEHLHSNGLYTEEALVIKSTQYYTISQKDNESVVEYRKRFLEAVRSIAELGGDVPSDSQQATKFLLSLDKTRYGELITTLHNTAYTDRGKSYPKTVDEVMRTASQYQVIPRTTASRPAVAFVAAKEPEQKKSRKKTEVVQKSHSKEAVHKGEKKQDKSKDAEDGREHKKKSASTCWHCDSPDHRQFDCPKYKEHLKKMRAQTFYAEADDSSDDERPAASISFPAVCLSVSSQPLDTDVIFDSGSSASLFRNADLLTDVRAENRSMEFRGLNGEVEAKHTGMFRELGRVWYSPDSPVNILSMSQVRKSGAVIKTIGPTIEVIVDGAIHQFRETKIGLYVKNYAQETTMMAVSTIPGSTLGVPHSELEKAKRARQFELNTSLNNISSVKYLASLSKTVSPKDIDSAYRLFGPPASKIKGIATEPRNRPTIASRSIEHTTTAVDLHADIMTISKETFLLAVAQPLGLIMTTPLRDGKKAPSLHLSIVDMINFCKQEGFRVDRIHMDGEKGMLPVADSLRHCNIKVLCTPGVHVPAAENAIKMVKGIIRATKESLPFKLPQMLMPDLVAYATQRANLAPVKKGLIGVPPIAAFTGIPVNPELDCKYAFGTFAQAVIPNMVGKNAITARSESVIVLTLHDRNGAYNCLSLGEKAKRRVRTSIRVMGITREAVERLEKLEPATLDELEDGVQDDVYIPEVEPKADPGPFLEVESGPQRETTIAKETTSITRESSNDELATIPAAPDIPDTPDTSTDAQAEAATTHAAQEEDSPTGDHEVTVPTVQEEELTVSSGEPGRPKRDRKDINYKLLSSRGYTYHTSVKEAIALHGEAATLAIEMELRQMLEKNVFTPVAYESNMKVINSFMFLKEKKDAEGKFVKMKARLVANGSMQRTDADTYSPTSSTTGLLLVAGLAARDGLVVTTADITGAYLNASMPADKPVNMRLDVNIASILCKLKPEFKAHLTSRGMVVRLEKALYGCLDSGRLWYEEISGTLIKNKYVRSSYDKCIFMKDSTYVVLYVDDLFIASKTQSQADQLIKILETSYQALSVHRGLVHEYLGLKFSYEEKTKLVVTMNSYQETLVQDWTISKTAPTPAREDLLQIDHQSPVLEKSKSEAFHSMVARLLYLAKRVRPDILLPVVFLTTRVVAPTEQDWRKLDRVIRYLGGTKDMGVRYEFNDDDVLPCYVDASFGVHEDGKSHTGSVILFGGGPIYVNSRKQKIVTKSSWEAEVVAASDSGTQILWVVRLLQELGLENAKAILYQDNQGAATCLEKGGSTAPASRHVSIRYFWLRDVIEEGLVSVEWIPTEKMVADGLTKPLQGKKFDEFRRALNNM